MYTWRQPEPSKTCPKRLEEQPVGLAGRTIEKAYRNAQALTGWMRGLSSADAVDLATVSVMIGVTVYFNISLWSGG